MAEFVQVHVHAHQPFRVTLTIVIQNAITYNKLGWVSSSKGLGLTLRFLKESQ